ncbi:hypothetical protein LXA43DRAFT_889084 [Ganoderma leucocontextum]|nr:hypothetical protein LXA43DRAFT_889084 [Ganoderma leucocontextum]
MEDDNSLQPTTDSEKVQAATRDSDYWFDDGNLILVSQGVSFRIYKGLLAEHSAVFHNMFHIGQAMPEEEDLVDGCPVVPLDDSPNDLRELFRLIYPLSINLKFSGKKVDIAFISAIIRLDHKYELKGVYNQAMGYLTTYYTTSFDAWVDGRNSVPWKPEPVHAIRAINLARLTNATSILPAAFYICATRGPDILHGFPHGDADADGSTGVERLTPADLRLCLEMKVRLADENAHTAFLLFRPPDDAQVCSNSLRYCADVWRKLLEHAGLSKAPHPVASERALDSWMENADCLPRWPLEGAYDPAARRTLCGGCVAHLQARDRELRRQVWGRLPELLGLTIENWDA